MEEYQESSRRWLLFIIFLILFVFLGIAYSFNTSKKIEHLMIVTNSVISDFKDKALSAESIIVEKESENLQLKTKIDELEKSVEILKSELSQMKKGGSSREKTYLEDMQSKIAQMIKSTPPPTNCLVAQEKALNQLCQEMAKGTILTGNGWYYCSLDNTIKYRVDDILSLCK